MSPLTLQSILRRLDKLEAAVISAPRERRQLSKAKVALRYDTSERTIDRYREHAKQGRSNFPLPVLDEFGRPKWWEHELDDYDRACGREQAAPK